MNVKAALISFLSVTLFLCVTVASAQQNALSFDGSNDLVEIEDNSILSGGAGKSLTVEAWIKLNSLTDYQPVVVKFEDFRTKDYGLRVTEDGGIQVDIENNSDDWFYAEGAGSISVGVWTHIAFTFDNDANTVRLYINGSEVGSGAFLSKDMPDSPASVMIGRNNYNPRFFDGEIDEVRIWNVARSESDLQSTMSALLSGNEAGLIGYWQFDEGSGQIAADASPSGNDGQLGTNSGSDSGDPAWIVSTAPVGDSDPPVISNVVPVNIREDAVTITWDTDEFSDSQVEYGLDTNYGNVTPLDPALVVNHSVEVTGLSPSQTYHFRVLSRDPSGNLAVSGDFTVTTSAPDLTPPLISNVSAGNVSSSAATILWNTDEPSDSQVEYGLDTNYGLTTPIDPNLVTSHTVELSGLSDDTRYHYRVISRDAAGNLTQSPDFTFTTLEAPSGGTGFALNFDGADDFVEIPDNEILSGGAGKSRTVEAWVNVASLPNTSPIVTKFFDHSSKDWGLSIDEGELQVDIENNGDNWSFSAGNVDVGVWTHVAFTFDKAADIVKLYINGTEVGSTPFSNQMPNSAGDIRFGSSEYNSRFIHGEIDEIRIWDYALSATELQSNMGQLLTGSEAGLIGYWQLDEGGGQSVSDLTANGNDGTLGTSSGSDSADPTWIQVSSLFEVVYPNGGETWAEGTTRTIIWTASGDINFVNLEYSTDSGNSWTTIASNIPNSGEYSWIVPAQLSTTVLIRASDAADGDPADTSDATFSIISNPNQTAELRTPFEITLEDANTYANPYQDASVTATFQGPNQTLTVPGFWDGGDAWKFRIAPGETGNWSYSTTSDDPGLQISGTFTVQSSTAKGGLVPQSGEPYHFEYEDGTPVWLFGETNWAAFRQEANENLNSATFRNYIDVRSAQGFNYIHGNLMAGDNEGGAPFTGSVGDLVNPAFWQEVDSRVQYMNDSGITAGLMLSWKKETPQTGIQVGFDYDWTDFPDQQSRQRFSEYVAARYGAYNVVWIISGEHDEEPGESPSTTTEWTELANAVEANDPHDRLMAIHGTGSVENFAGQPWMDFGDYMQIYNDLNDAILNARDHDMPVVNSEYGYFLRDEDGDGIVEKSNSATPEQFRAASWDIVMGGGYFVSGFATTYLGGRRDSGPFDVTAAQNDPAEEDLGHIRDFFNNLNWWEYEPDNSLVVGDTSYALHKNDEEYVVYTRGNTGGLSVNLLYPTPEYYDIQQFNPRTGSYSTLSSQVGGTSLSLTPPDQQDWVYIVTRTTGPLTVHQPNGGESWGDGTTHEILWVPGTAAPPNVRIEFSSDGGSTWSDIVAGTANDGNHSWTVPSVQSGNCLIRISDAADGTPVDQSDSAFSIEADATPPIISNVTAGNIDESSATITWDTDEPSDSQVEYGLTTSYGNTTSLDPALVTGHSVSLSGLSENTTYHYRVLSRDASGNLSQSGDFTFTTQDGTPGGGAGFALEYDGSDDFVHVDDTEVLSGGSGKSITVEAWIKVASLATDGPVISKFLDANTKDWGLKVEVDGTLQVDIENNGDNWAYNAGSVSTNVWTHVAFTFDNAAELVRIYVNGVQAGSGTTLTKNMPNSSAPVRIGNSEYNDKFFTGEIDEVRIWDVARTASELQATMNTVLTGTESGLIAYWKFDEGSGQFSSDLTGNGQDGRLGASTGSNSSDPGWITSEAPIDGNDFITVQAPNGGETWVTNSNQIITWSSNFGGSVRIEFSTDGGASWSDIAASTANDGSHSWTIPANINSSNCLIRISDAADGDPTDVSDASFTIDSSVLLSFSDITIAAGLGGVTEGGHSATVSDVDDDGRPDSYITSLVTNSASSDLFFHNKGSNSFAEEAGTRGIADFDGGSHGAVFADLDNDGDFDLFNGTTGLLDENGGGTPEPNNIFRNDGNGFFTDITGSIGTSMAEELTRGVVAFDMDNDGDLDLFAVTNFLGSNDPPGETNEIYRNDGNMQFTAIKNGALYTVPAGQGAADTDYDGDGDIDIIAGNRTGDLNILRNDGNGNFTLISPASVGINHRGKEGASMGDIDNDGDLDMLLADFDDTNNYHIKHLYRNDGDGTFTFVTTFEDMNGYMGGFADLDNDGDLDLVGAGDEVVFLNDGNGNFTAGPIIPVGGISDPRAIGFMDSDGDGDQDFVVAAKGSRNWLVRNDVINAGNWLKVKLISPWGQAGAFGAKTRIYAAGDAGGTPLAMRESRSAHGYLGQDDPVLHFGLDTRQSVDVVTTFLDGSTITLQNVSANQTLVIDALTENLLVTSPNGGEVWSPGSTQDITWNSSGNLTSVTIELSSDGGANWNTVVSGTANDGSYSWTVPNLQSSDCLIRVSDAADGDPFDVSDNAFSIESDNTPPVISNVTAGAIGNDTATITWNTDEPSDTQVEYGVTTGYGNLSSLDPTLVTSHTVVLSGLSENTTYHFRVLSRDASGNLAQGSDFTFTTTNTPGGGAGFALDYDGSDDFVNVDDTELLSGGSGKSITVEAWIKVSSLATDGPVISKFLDANTKDWGLKVEADGSLQVDIENNGDNWAYNAGSVNTDVWAHVAFTFDNSANLVRIFVNGVQAGSGTTLTKNMPNSSAPVRIGNSEYNDKFFTGEIDEVRIWNFARSASELQSTMNEVLNGDEPGLIGYWSFDEGGGQDVADLSGNGHDGQLGASGGSNSSDPSWVQSDAPLSGDETPPLISNVATGNIGETIAAITWNTDEPSDSRVEYGTDTNYGNSTTLDPTLVAAHSVNLTGLTASTTYHFRVLSRDAAGNLATSGDFTFTTSSPDLTPPVISNVSSSNVSSSGATVEWDTDEISDSQVEYGLDTNYGNSTSIDPSLVTSHTVLLSGLLADTTYHYRVKSRDASGNLAMSGDFTFTTQAGGITQSGFAMSFDGSDDYVMIEDNELLSGGSGKSITVEAWIMVSSLSQDAPIVNKYLDAFFKDWGLQVKTDGSLQVDIENNGDNWFYGAGNVPVSVWTHVAFTFDNATDQIRLFINGSEVGSGEILSKNMPNTTADIRIGSVEYNQSFCDGFIDEVRIWDFARSESEIQSTMDSKLAGNESGLIGYWDFETGSGQTVVDLTGNGNDGQLGPTAGSDIEDPTWFALPLAPFLELTYPNGGETLYFGSVMRVEWNSNPLISEIDVELSTNSGASWQTIGANVPNSEGFYDWEIPWNMISSNCLIRITDSANSNRTDVSESEFAIEDLFETSATLPDLKQWVGPLPGGLLDAEIRTSSGETRLQFSGTAINTGVGPLDLQGTFNNQGLLPAFQRIYQPGGSSEDIYVGTFEFATHPNHNHFHLQDFNVYRLREVNPDSSVGDVVATSDKLSFCITDSDPYNLALPGAAPQPVYTCEQQGISIGWGDLYDKNTFGQWIVINSVPSGTYWLEAEVNPDSVVFETDMENNVERVLIEMDKSTGEVTILNYNPPSVYSQHVNAGGPLLQTGGKRWEADQPFSLGSWGHNGGQSVSTSDDIKGTSEDELYHDQQEGMTSYQFTVPTVADYRVDFHFVEIVHNAPGQRVFDVYIEDTLVLDDLDLFATLGHDSLKVYTFQETVDDGIVDLRFESVTGEPLVAAINVVEMLPTSAFVRVEAPNGGETFGQGSSQTISWSTSGGIDDVMIEFSDDGGTTWSTVTASTPNTGTYSWTVPNITTNNGMIRITDVADPQISDVSDAPFTINQQVTLGNMDIVFNTDDEYELYVNGNFVGSDTQWNQAQSYSVPLLSGKNVLAVRGINGGGPGGVLAEVRYNGELIFLTDTQWKRTESPPANWQDPGLDDSAWLNAVDVGPYTGNVSGFPANSSARWIWLESEDDLEGYFRGTFYAGAPQITSFTPGSGGSGTEVTITGSNFVGSLGALDPTQTVRIMPLGNSITQGIHGSTDNAGYRNDLASLLDAQGIAYDFVGSLTDGTGFDNDHEGHSGFRADEILTNLNSYLSGNPPEIILLHIGTNDISDDQTPESTRDEIDAILDDINTFDPGIYTLVASIVPRKDTRDPETTTLNGYIANLVSDKQLAGYRVYYAGINEAFKADPDWATLYYPVGDDVHPNDTGYAVMSGVWFDEILELYNSTANLTVAFNGTNAAGLIIDAVNQVRATVPTGATTGPISVFNLYGTGTSASDFSVTSSTSTLALIHPAGGEQWTADSPRVIAWQAPKNVERVTLEFSEDGGASWQPLARQVKNTGKYVWTVPDVTSEEALVRVSDSGKKASAVSKRFTVHKKDKQAEVLNLTAMKRAVLGQLDDESGLHAKADLNRDGEVNLFDLLRFVDSEPKAAKQSQNRVLTQRDGVQVSSPQLQVVKDERIELPVEIQGETPIRGFQIEFEYDNTSIELEEELPYTNEYGMLLHAAVDGNTMTILGYLKKANTAVTVEEALLTLTGSLKQAFDGQADVNIKQALFAGKDNQPLAALLNAADAGGEIPTDFSLEQNYPNPFNLSTQIKYNVPTKAKVKLEIYNVKGELVRTLIDDKEIEPGQYRIEWDGKNQREIVVASGIYIYRMKAGKFEHAKRMTLIK